MPGTQRHERQAELLVRLLVATENLLLHKFRFLGVHDVSNFVKSVGNVCGTVDEQAENI